MTSSFVGDFARDVGDGAEDDDGEDVEQDVDDAEGGAYLDHNFSHISLISPRISRRWDLVKNEGGE